MTKTIPWNKRFPACQLLHGGTVPKIGERVILKFPYRELIDTLSGSQPKSISYDRRFSNKFLAENGKYIKN